MTDETTAPTNRKFISKTEAAKARASISAFLSRNLGRDYSTEEVAKHIGKSSRTTGQLLGGMARGGLIAQTIVNHKKRWAWPLDGVASNVEQPVKPTRKKNSTKPTTPAEEVELCIGGITVVVGRNELTGRIRITLEA